VQHSYDEDRVLTAYIWEHYRHLFTEFEKQVDVRIKVEIKSRHMSKEMREERLTRFCGPPDPAVDRALEDGHWAFLDQVRARVLAEAEAQVVINRCPMCSRIVRTPKARQCMWCHHDWHPAARGAKTP
jgi:hypothetical protein